MLVAFLLLTAFFLRIFRISTLLDFHFDQGRDALVIWDLWHKGKLFLIGPVTGLDGVFLGPLYYYLIAPFYLIGKGNPVFPSVFLSFLVTLGLFFLYQTGKLLGDKKLGLTVLVIGTFSNYFIFSGRWLSNPTPIYLTSILVFYLMLKICLSAKLHWYFWPLLYFLAGISFHFEAASAVFYLPILIVFTFWQSRKINLKTLLFSVGLLFFTFLPQFIFNFKHGNLILNNLFRELPKTEPSTASLWRIAIDREKALWEVFANKIFPQKGVWALLFGVTAAWGLVKLKKQAKFQTIFKLFLIFLGIPFVGYLLYRGNYGILYDYYLTGYYLILILPFALGLWALGRVRLGFLILPVFIILFMIRNLELTGRKLATDPTLGRDIFISNQEAALDWIFKDAKGSEFNVDVYVPPVLPYSYDYLFKWYPTTAAFRDREIKQIEVLVPLLYTLYEIDQPHPERLDAWLRRQKSIAKVEKEAQFGGITVQRRFRLK